MFIFTELFYNEEEKTLHRQARQLTSCSSTAMKQYMIPGKLVIYIYIYIYIYSSIHPVPTLCVCSVTQSSPTVCNPMDCNPPGFSVHGIILVRILECVAMPSSKGSSWLRDWTHVPCDSCIGRQILYHWATWEALPTLYGISNNNAAETALLTILLFVLSLRKKGDIIRILGSLMQQR